MLLTPDDAALFYQAWGSILVWVNEQRHVVPPFPAPTPGHPIEPPITNQLRKVLWADDIWLGCAGPGPALAPFGAGMHDFSPNAIRASQDRVRLRGHAYCGRSGVAEPAAGAVIELVESTSDRLIESTRTDCAGYFELAASRRRLRPGSSLFDSRGPRIDSAEAQTMHWSSSGRAARLRRRPLSIASLQRRTPTIRSVV